MTIEESRAFILERIHSIDDEAKLRQLIDVLEEDGTMSFDNEILDAFYERVKAQYGDVLQKLAQ